MRLHVSELLKNGARRQTTRNVSAHVGGAEEDRTPNLLRARQALSQLSYGPRMRVWAVVGLGGLEPPTSPLSGVRSDQLSYRPVDSWKK